MTDHKAPSERTRVKRYHWLANYSPETLHDVIDATPFCHVGYVRDGLPRVTPTMHWRDGNRIYWHGSSASQFLRAAAAHPVCVNICLVDGLVMARSAYNCTLNYRSATLYGDAIRIDDMAEKARRLAQMVDRLVPGHWQRMRPVTAQELKATTVLSLDLSEASVKLRSGHAQDDPEDYGFPVWSGVIPVRYTTGEPEADPRNLPVVVMPEVMRTFSIG